MQIKWTIRLWTVRTHGRWGLSPPCISKNLLHNMLALQTFAYIDVTNGGVFNRLFLAVLVKNQ